MGKSLHYTVDSVTCVNMCKYITKQSSGAKKIGGRSFKYIDIRKKKFVPKANSRFIHVQQSTFKHNKFLL